MHTGCSYGIKPGDDVFVDGHHYIIRRRLSETEVEAVPVRWYDVIWLAIKRGARWLRNLLPLLALLLVCGCASSGRRIDPNAVAQIQRGQTTRQEVLKLLGSPETMTTLGDGTSQFNYYYSRATTKGTTFIPVAGAFVGGSNVQTQIVTVTFGPDGIVRDVMSTASAQDVNMGGSKPAPIPEVIENKRER